VTEDDARAALARYAVPRETWQRLDHFVALLREEARRQNLIAASTLDHIYARHVLDSAQLLDLAPDGSWLDLGSGAGFPGLIVALIGDRPVTLIESRRKRVEFLTRVAAEIDLVELVNVRLARVEMVQHSPFRVISARAFAPLPRLFEVAHHLSDADTTWVLPKGTAAQAELARARESWQGRFTLVPSVTSADASIIVAQGVKPGRQT
jgi:16S rRNA (guanine527-N7)-methyltransferase